RPDHRRNKLSADNPIFDIADRLRFTRGLDAEALGHLYVAAGALDLRLFEMPRRPTIQESTIPIRSFAFYAAREMGHLANAFRQLLDSYPVFDVSVVLTASLEVRRGRLEMRRRAAPGEIADDDELVNRDPDTFRRMENALIEQCTKRFDAFVL